MGLFERGAYLLNSNFPYPIEINELSTGISSFFSLESSQPIGKAKISSTDKMKYFMCLISSNLLILYNRIL